jgi:hypothetical protein
LIGGEYNNAQKPFQEVQTGDSINKCQLLETNSGCILELTDTVD